MDPHARNPGGRQRSELAATLYLDHVDAGRESGIESLAELGLPGSPNPTAAPRWSRPAFVLGVAVVIALAAFAVLVVIPSVVSLLAELIAALPAGAG